MTEIQINRMIKEMKARKVKNYEFARMGILSHTRRIKDIREKGINVEMQRIYKDGKATGTFEYWIPKSRSNWFANKLASLK